MKIFIKVIPNSKTEKVIDEGEGNFQIKVRAPAKEGKANKALIKLLSDYLKIPKNKISIVCGETSKSKIIEIQ